MAKTENRVIKAEALLNTRGGNRRISISQVGLQNSINSIPQGNLEFHMLGSGAVRIDLSKTIEVSALLQNEYYNNPPDRPNIIINLDDGNSGDNLVQFRGYFLAPGVHSGPGNFGLTGNIRGRTIELQNFVPSIWETNYTAGLKEASIQRGYINPLVQEAQSSIGVTTSLAERLFIILKTLEKNKVTPEFYQSNRCGDASAIFQQLYAQNELYKDFAYDFLRSSFGSTPFNTANESLSREITNYLYAMLMSNRMSFWDTLIRVICPNFFLQVIDDFSGNIRLETYNPLAEPGDGFEISITERFNSQLSESSRFPLKGVIAEADLLDDGYKIEEHQEQTRNPSQSRYFAQFPRPRAGQGRIDTVKIPEWLSRVILKSTNILSNDTKRSSDGPGTKSTDTGLTFEQSLQSIEQLKRVIATEQVDVCRILRSWARFHYFDRVLKNSTITATVPLNLKLFSGRTYTVKTANGDEVAKGFLQNVTHNIQLTNEAGDGTTTLFLTHVRSKGLRIPT